MTPLSESGEEAESALPRDGPEGEESEEVSLLSSLGKNHV